MTKQLNAAIETNQALLNGFSQWEQIDARPESFAPIEVDEMGPKQHERFAQNYMLVCLKKAGSSTQEALERAGLKITTNAARKLCKRFEKFGVSGILDGRSNKKRKNKQVVLTPELKKRTLAWYWARPAAGPRAIWKEISKECREHGVRSPGYDCVKKYIQSLPEPYRLFRLGKIGVHEWERSFRPVVRFSLACYSNQRWQIDNSRLNIWVRVFRNGEWVPSLVHLCACMCEHSRSIPGFILSSRDPDAWTTALLIQKAVTKKEDSAWKNKGLPAVLQPDRGKTFLAHAVISSLGYLGVAVDPDPPYYPNRKGKIERWFLTLDRGCLRILPGHMDSIGHTIEAAAKHVNILLTVPQLRKEIERWIVSDYHQHEHSETKRKPAELWEETVRLRMPESDDALRLLLLKSDQERTIRNTGISFKFRDAATDDESIYWSPDLIYSVGERVRIRYNPDDRESILVYSASTGSYIGEAWLMGNADSRYTIADVQQSRSEFKRGLQERVKDYIEEIERGDRQRASDTEWNEVRSTIEHGQAEEPKDNGADDPSEFEELLAQFDRQDAGFTPRGRSHANH